MTRMFDAISPSEFSTAPGGVDQRGAAAVELAFARRDGHTRLTRLYQRTPLRALFPRHEAGDLPVAALVNVGGGLVAGDRAAISVHVGADAAVLVTSQAAEKVYRSTGADCRITTRLTVGQGGWLEWCPQETILFDRSRLRRRLLLEVAGDARAMLGEILVLGRHASGEQTDSGFLHDRIEVHRDGALAWLDTFRLDGAYAPVLAAAAGLGGARAAATFVYAATDAVSLLDRAREWLQAAGVRAGATLVNGLLIARFLAVEALVLRRAFALFWCRFREAAAGLPPALPRLWHV
jgi:urease accessory protein